MVGSGLAVGGAQGTGRGSAGAALRYRVLVEFLTWPPRRRGRGGVKFRLVGLCLARVLLYLAKETSVVTAWVRVRAQKVLPWYPAWVLLKITK